mmetsp:Transcript_14406/g.23604  ORF Transcript_14406/g.23604 Transcript_14406/m.23604 type:complete len:109 (+) Transcript_14406:351-677(+)
MSTECNLIASQVGQHYRKKGDLLLMQIRQTHIVALGYQTRISALSQWSGKKGCQCKTPTSRIAFLRHEVRAGFTWNTLQSRKEMIKPCIFTSASKLFHLSSASFASAE